MHDNHIIYAAEPRTVSTDPDTQFEAFLDELDRVYETCPDGDWTEITNLDWVSLFGLYWGCKPLVTSTHWTTLWRKIRSEMDHPVEDSGYDGWAWFARAMNWRRQKVRTQRGQGKQRWASQKNTPKHEAQKVRNAEAQRRRRARKAIPELPADILEAAE